MELVNEVATLLSKYGIDATLVVAVIFLTFLLKSFDKRNRFKQGYVVFPFLSSIVVTGVSTWLGSAEFNIVTTLVYAGVSAWLYDIYSTARKAKGK
jgi:hypothetical protein